MKIKTLFVTALLAAGLGLAGCQTANSGGQKQIASAQQYRSTLADVKARGYLSCGVSQGLPGFSYPDNRGRWAGFDVDFCRAVAAAIFGDGDKVRFVPLSPRVRFTALQSGEIDLLSRNTSWTYSRDSALGLDYPAISFYEGQAFMVRNRPDARRMSDLKNPRVCLKKGDNIAYRAETYLKKQGISYQPVYFDRYDMTVAAYNAGRCDVYTTDRTGLAAQRIKLSNPEIHTILEEFISREPLGPLVRHGDNMWSDVVRWTFNTLILAEQEGITSKNVLGFKSDNREVQYLLGSSQRSSGQDLNLSRSWAKDIIREVGNYGEIFTRNLGPNTDMNIKRSLNLLWTEGGQMYPLPFR